MDHKSLKYFITTKKLIRHQVYLAKVLLGFNFIIFYTISKDNTKANALI